MIQCNTFICITLVLEFVESNSNMIYISGLNLGSSISQCISVDSYKNVALDMKVVEINLFNFFEYKRVHISEECLLTLNWLFFLLFVRVIIIISKNDTHLCFGMSSSSLLRKEFYFSVCSHRKCILSRIGFLVLNLHWWHRSQFREGLVLHLEVRLCFWRDKRLGKLRWHVTQVSNMVLGLEIWK